MCPKVSFAVKKNLIEPIEEDYPALFFRKLCVETDGCTHVQPN